MKKQRRWFRLGSTIVIWGLLTATWALVWYFFYAGTIQLPFYRRGNWAVVGIYGAILYFITQFYGGYQVGYYQRGNLIFSCLLSMLVTNGLTYLQVAAIGRMALRWDNFRPILWMSLIDFVLIWIWASAATQLYLKNYPPRDLLLVYGGDRMAESLVSKLLEREDKYVVHESIDIKEGLPTVLKTIDRYQAIVICDVKSSHRNKLLKYCYQKDIRVYMTPKISDILVRASTDIHLFDSPLLLSRNQGLSAEQRIFKRGLDLLVSGLGLAITSPFLLLVAIAIKLEDGGAVFYSQTRLTENGKAFQLHKFRSMVPDAEKRTGARLAGKNDPRITRVGRVIRRLRLDELPQLVNVFKGEMSLVGPRPERPEIAAIYRRDMSEFDFRLKVKAGLTGYAQVVGKYNTTPYDKLKLDLMYIAGYSFLLDLKLILQTIKTVFMWGKTEGVASGGG